ncbi:MAG: iron-only hydrogenase system regulator [Oscillospiraceae bacterium]|nr:iron-only hydrogenase system regulator [Oscillospiraceae bacterium]
METRVALLGIVVECEDSVEQINRLLHSYKDYVVGRMGIPYRDRGVNIISIVMDAPGDAISTLSGKLGMLPGVSAKTLYAKLPEGK